MALQSRVQSNGRCRSSGGRRCARSEWNPLYIHCIRSTAACPTRPQAPYTTLEATQGVTLNVA